MPPPPRALRPRVVDVRIVNAQIAPPAPETPSAPPIARSFPERAATPEKTAPRRHAAPTGTPRLKTKRFRKQAKRAASPSAVPVPVKTAQPMPEPHQSIFPPPAAPSSQKGPPREEETTTARQRYHDAHFLYVRDRILGHLTYPVLAKRMRWQGTVVVAFSVLEDGAVEGIQIKRSSGHLVLDDNVMRAIETAQPFPPPPSRVAFTMPITYTLHP